MKKKTEKHSAKQHAYDSDPEWGRAKKLCRLNAEEIRMAKELRFNPRTLTSNIPSPKQRWKAPVSIWIRELYEKRHPGQGFPPGPPAEPPKLFWHEEQEQPPRDSDAAAIEWRDDDAPF